MIKKILKIILLILIIVFLAIFAFLFIGKAKSADKTEWGVTFSKRYAIELKLDWKKIFLDILDDLEAKKIRLVAYWDETEIEEGKYNFDDLDWQVNEIEKRGGEIIFAVGRRMPRWPECYEPEWAKGIEEKEKQTKVLEFIAAVINHYKDNKSIKIWQIENEPFLRTFGKCPWVNTEFLDKEIALARHLDPTRPIMITESGEFSTWVGSARRADIVGISIYHKIHGKLGYVEYPIPAIFYQRKSNLIKTLFDIDEIIPVEVQAEPWGNKPTQDLTNEEQDISMSLEKFNEAIEYTRKAGFNKGYLWGVEWWYWRKEKGDSRFWDRAKELF